MSIAGDRARILIVDDESDITHIVKSALEKQGLIVDAFNDPILALESFKPGYYHLALIDIRMPAMNGFELFTEIRRVDPKIDVCFLTAYEQYDGYLTPALKDDRILDCLIKKPASINSLIKLIMNRLAKGWT